MKRLSVLLFCLLSMAGKAQQYLIRYDLHEEKTKYFRVKAEDTLRIKSIDLKKSGRITLQVNNYNPFYWNAKVTAFKTPVDQEVGYGDAFNPFSVLAGGLGDLMSGLPKIDLPKNRGALSRDELDEKTFNYLSTVAKYASQYEDLQLLNKKVEDLQTAKLELIELKYDIRKKESTIKAEAETIIKKVLNTNELELGNVLDIGKNYNTRLSTALTEATSLVNSIQVQQKSINPAQVYEDKTLKEIGDNATSSYQKLDRLRTAQAGNPNLILDDVAAVAKLYKEIAAANFQFVYAVKNEDEISDIKLEIYPKVETGQKDTLVQFFELTRRQYVRIKNSLGIAFTFFPENNTSYFIGADSIIRRGDRDLFTPLLSTLIHFYPGKSKGLKIGGTFGFGIPLQGEKKDVNFLLGLSAAVGKNEPVLISLGAAGAKVSKLSYGNQLGAKTRETDPAKLTSSGYGIGGFLSVTFNLSNLGIGKK